MRRSFILICVALLLSMFANAQSFTITATAGENGTIDPSGAVTVVEGEDQAFSITASTGYRIASVLVDDEEAKNDLVEGVYTFTSVDADHTIAATFEEIPQYTITVASNNDEFGSVTGGGTYYEDETVTLTAVPSEHYHFVKWNDENTDNPREITVTGAATYTATFEEDPHYTITVESNNGEYGTVSGGGSYYAGETVSISATAAEHYHFVKWNDENTDNPREITVTETVTYTATFEEDPHYTITVESNNGEYGTVSGGGSYYAGETVSIYATPAEHYHFVKWNDENTDNPREITVTETVTYTATFEEDPHYTITVESNNDEYGTVSGGGSYYAGETVSISATAAEHYHFVKWNDENTDNPREITVTETVTYTATFEEDPQYTITVLSNNDEYGTVSGGGSYYAGETVSISATAAEHYHFVKWNDENTDNPREITVTETVTYTATFEEDPHYTITVESNNDEYGTVSGGGSYYAGETVSISATAAEHYHFVKWNDENTDNPREITVTGTATYTATFEADPVDTYTITATAGVGGSITPASANVEEGANHTVYIIANDGYRIERVMVDVETNVTSNVVNGAYTFENVTADHSIEATFAEIPVGPYFEFVDLQESYSVGDSVKFAIKVHSNGNVDNLCAVDYKIKYSSNVNGNPSMNLSDLSRYGMFSYDISLSNGTVLTTPITRGSGSFSANVEYNNSTYDISAFTLGLLDNDCVNRNRPVDFDMVFTRSGKYQFTVSLATCSNGGDAIGTSFVAENCDGMTHYDRYANTCTNKTVVKDYVFTMKVQGANACTVTTSVPDGHGTISPEGTTVVSAGQDLELTFTPDENYELDSLLVNGVTKYPAIDGSVSVVDNHYTLTNIRSNQDVVAKFRDVRPYYNIHVEIETAGGSVTPTDTTVVAGSDVTLSIMPNQGFHISQLEVDGNIVIDYASTEIVFRNVNSDHHIKISFFPNSVEENMFANLSIYPNPNNGQFTISSDDFDGDVTFQIFSVSGAVMDEVSVSGEKTVNFDKSLPAGTYFVRIIAGDKVATRKIVVE